MRTLFLYFIIGVVVSGCQSDTSTSSKPVQAVELVTNLQQLVPLFSDMDSISISLYKNPFGDDKENYTRYYTQLNTTDPDDTEILKNTLSQHFVKQDTLRDCRSEGKIHCFSRGKIFQTIYFASQPSVCVQAYIIREGYYYYVPLDNSWIKAMRDWKQRAADVP